MASFLKGGKMARLVAFNFVETKPLLSRSRTDPRRDLNWITLEIISIQKKTHLNPEDLQDLRQILGGFHRKWGRLGLFGILFLDDGVS